MFNIKHGKHDQPAQRAQGMQNSKISESKLEPGEIVVSVSGGKRDAIKSTKYSKDEIDKMLNGYVSLPQKSWAALDHGAHVRYIRLDGRFVRGGFVSGYSMQNGRRLLTLANGFNATAKGYSVWTIGLDSIKQLYVKKTAVPSSSRISAAPNVQTKTSEIATLKKIIADMQKRLDTLEGKSIKK